jgi:hypothetical protein
MGFLADIEKYNAAAALGWRVIRAVPDSVVMGKTRAIPTLTSATTMRTIRDATGG